MIERPVTLPGETEVVMTGCGHLYVTVNWNGHGPIEVISRLGKAGGCSSCQNEALTRAITLGLKSGVLIEEFVRELTGISCPSPNLYPEEKRVLSCADGIAQVLKRCVKKDS